jgi:hypothetical protein
VVAALARWSVSVQSIQVVRWFDFDYEIDAAVELATRRGVIAGDRPAVAVAGGAQQIAWNAMGALDVAGHRGRA